MPSQWGVRQTGTVLAKVSRNMRISDLLHSKGTSVFTVAPSATIQHVVEMLDKWRVGAVVVSTDGLRIEGILSERDIVRSMVSTPDTLSLLASDLMTADVVTCEPDVTVNALMELMTKRRIRHIPVVEDDVLAGIVSIGDIVKSRVNELESEMRELHQYISVGG